MDKVFLRFVRCTLGIKATTSNNIVIGECGLLPPSTRCTINALCYLNRIMYKEDDCMVKQVFLELKDLAKQGFNTWVTSLNTLVDKYHIDLNLDPQKFKPHCKNIVRSNFIKLWTKDLHDTNSHPLLRTYRYIKLSFMTEPYLNLVKDRRYRNAISKLRTSSHILHIEKGRHTRPITPFDQRLCSMCQCVEDELHFVTACCANDMQRNVLYSKVTRKFPPFETLDNLGKFIFLFTFKDAQMLTWLGKFLYESFEIRTLYII